MILIVIIIIIIIIINFLREGKYLTSELAILLLLSNSVVGITGLILTFTKLRELSFISALGWGGG